MMICNFILFCSTPESQRDKFFPNLKKKWQQYLIVRFWFFTKNPNLITKLLFKVQILFWCVAWWTLSSFRHAHRWDRTKWDKIVSWVLTFSFPFHHIVKNSIELTNLWYFEEKSLQNHLIIALATMISRFHQPHLSFGQNEVWA